MTYKKILIGLGFLFTLGCGPGVDLTVNGPGGKFDPDVIKKVESQYCSVGFSLKELSGATDARFGELRQRSSIFAFTVDKDVACITTKNINDAWTAEGVPVWFNLNLNGSNCLPNNSIWEVASESTSGSGRYYYLRNVADPSQRLLEMNAHFAVRGSYASERVGFKILACQR